VYELASIAVGTVAFLLELMTGPGLVLGGQGIPGPDFLIAVGEVALARARSTLSPKGHSIAFTQYLHT
jgi:hypothetical protein